MENACGARELNKRACANCAARRTETDGGGVAVDQDEHLKQLRPMQRPELTGAEAGEMATKTVSDVFVCLRGALVSALLAQVLSIVHGASFRRVQNRPTCKCDG